MSPSVRPSPCSEIQEIEKKFLNAELVDANGQVGVKVRCYLLGRLALHRG